MTSSNVENLVSNAVERSHSTLLDRHDETSDTSQQTTKQKQQEQKQQHLPFSKNPNMVTTALAHLLWQQALQPGIDIAIDATCGNGNDSLQLAKLLFPSSSSNDNDNQEAPSINNENNKSQLYCIDIQDDACRATREKLEPFKKNEIFILQQSHAKLPSLQHVGLVCYNLGYLPNHPQNKHIMTQTRSTLESLVQAAQLIRIGGLLSVMTYPQSNPNEDYAVRSLFQCMGLLSSSSKKNKKNNGQDDNDSWQNYIATMDPDPQPESSTTTTENENDDKKMPTFMVRQLVSEAMEKLTESSSSVNTSSWRVMEHKVIGRKHSPPILLIATRIR